MIPAIGFGFLLTTMMMGKLYPKQTIIIAAIIILCILALPVITHVDLSSAALCSCGN